MRVFFNILNSGEAIRDHEGIEVSDLDEARTQAQLAVEEMRSGNPASARDWAGWRLAADDQSGTALFTLDLGPGATH